MRRGSAFPSTNTTFATRSVQGRGRIKMRTVTVNSVGRAGWAPDEHVRARERMLVRRRALSPRRLVESGGDPLTDRPRLLALPSDRQARGAHAWCRAARAVWPGFGRPRRRRASVVEIHLDESVTFRFLKGDVEPEGAAVLQFSGGVDDQHAVSGQVWLSSCDHRVRDRGRRRHGSPRAAITLRYVSRWP